jgi:hypothetical protein
MVGSTESLAGVWSATCPGAPKTPSRAEAQLAACDYRVVACRWLRTSLAHFSPDCELSH